MKPSEIESIIHELPDDIRSEVLDYIEFLIERDSKKKRMKRTFKFDWEGGLSELREKYTSVELQHKASEWR